MRRIRLGIKPKMTLAFGSVFTLLALLFNFNTFQHIRDEVIADNDQYLLARASSLLSKTEVVPAIIPLPDNHSYIRVFYHTNGQYRLVFESPGIPGGIRNPVDPGVYDTLGMRVAYVRNTSSSTEDNPAELLMVTSGQSLDERLIALRDRMFLTSLITLLIAACFSYLLAEFLLNPLRRIIETARSINTGGPKQLIPVHQSGDELQELTETLNAMLNRISNAQRQQQNFFASASHELKTPLAVLRAELELKLNQPDVGDDIRQLLHSQLTEIKRLQDRIDEFLVVSQLKQGSLTLRKAPFDLSRSIMRTFDQLRLLMQEQSLTPSIRFDTEAGDFMVNGDEDKISIVLMNVLENAIKYSVPGTSVNCSIHRPAESGHTVIEIENTTRGQSLPTGQLQDAFYRGESLKSGAGLGLWLCSRIVELHSGSLLLSSENHRFRVTIELP